MRIAVKSVRKLIAQNSLHEVEILVDHRRRFRFLRVLANVLPRAHQVLRIGAQIASLVPMPAVRTIKPPEGDILVCVNLLNQLAQTTAFSIEIRFFAKRRDARPSAYKPESVRAERCVK